MADGKINSGFRMTVPKSNPDDDMQGMKRLDVDGNGTISTEEVIQRLSGFTATNLFSYSSDHKLSKLYDELVVRSPETAEKMVMLCNADSFCSGPWSYLFKHLQSRHEKPAPRYQGAFLEGNQSGIALNLHRYGSFLETVPDEMIEKLLNTHRAQIRGGDDFFQAMMEDSLHMKGVNTALLLELHRLAIYTAKKQKFPGTKSAYASPIFREKTLTFARSFLETLAKNEPAEQGASEPVEKTARKMMNTLLSD